MQDERDLSPELFPSKFRVVGATMLSLKCCGKELGSSHVGTTGLECPDCGIMYQVVAVEPR